MAVASTGTDGVVDDPTDVRNDVDSQLSGAFVVDPPGAPAPDRPRR